MGDNAALGTGTLTLRGIGASSTIRSDTATARTINNAIVFSGTGVDIHFGSASTGNLTFGGTVDLGTGNRTIEVDNATTTFSNTISGSGGITTAGSGTLVLGGSNTFTGGVTINSGTVQAGSITALGPAANAALTFGAGSTGKFQLNGNNTTIVDLTTNATVGTPVIENNNATAATLTVNTANSDTYGGVLQNGATGTLALAKSGSGTLTLSGNNTYTGGTKVSAGTLFANNATSSTGTGTVTVNGTGTLSGNGKINGGVIVNSSGSAINAGAMAGAIDVLNINNGSLTALTMTSTSKFIVDMTATTADQLNITGLVNLGTTSLLQLNIPNGTTFTPGQQFTLINNDSTDPITGTFSKAQTGTDIMNGYAFVVSYTGGTGNDFVITAVPEPSTWAAASLALLFIGYTQRRKLVPALKSFTAAAAGNR